MARTKAVTEEVNTELPEVPFPRFSATFYLYSIIGEDRYPGQITVQDSSPEAFMSTYTEVMKQMADKSEDNLVFYAPREVQSANYGGGGNRGGSGTKPDSVPQPEPAPNCPIHQSPITRKNGKFGPFYSCSMKNADGTYCNWAPPKAN